MICTYLDFYDVAPSKSVLKSALRRPYSRISEAVDWLNNQGIIKEVKDESAFVNRGRRERFYELKEELRDEKWAEILIDKTAFGRRWELRQKFNTLLARMRDAEYETLPLLSHGGWDWGHHRWRLESSLIRTILWQLFLLLSNNAKQADKALGDTDRDLWAYKILELATMFVQHQLALLTTGLATKTRAEKERIEHINSKRYSLILDRFSDEDAEENID